MSETIPYNSIVGNFTAIFGTLSFLSTLCVFGLYIFNKPLQSFTFRMIVYMQISDFLLSIGVIMISYETFSQKFNINLCRVQAFLLNFGVLATTFWTFILTSLMLLSLKASSNIYSLKKNEKFFVIVGYAFPFILTMM